MIDSLAEKLARSIKIASEDDKVNEEVMKFALIISLNTAIVVLISLIIGQLTGKVVETGITILSFSLLRIVSGGFHFKSANLCTVISISFAVILPHIPITSGMNYILLALSLLLVILYAPSNIEGHSRIPKENYSLLKGVSVIIVLSNFLFLSPILSKAFFIQSITLINRGR
ncbi:accessory gene regulator B family protein [Brevibacterium sp. JNUCC-42]|nr:accessory gene regulator B family protein [Brevibacterium sp. JNUCC-42]